MKLTDYVIDFLANEGIDCIFGVTGGSVVHLFDSADKNKKTRPIFCHHEQAASLAAVSYARIKNSLGACIVTTGPGGTNAITGLSSAWFDSIPCIFISGQARVEHTTHNKPVRQVGGQQMDIVSFVKPMAKYSVMIEDAKTIKYHLQKAVHIAKSGRPGPVWIDLPLNFQWAQIEPKELQSFDASEMESKQIWDTSFEAQCGQVAELIKKSQRPLIVAGYGIRLAGGIPQFEKFIAKTNIPFVCTWGTRDFFPTKHPGNLGCIGVSGQRGANLAIQNCDLVISIGSHLCLTLTGGRFDAFARGAKKVIVDIDPVELGHTNIKFDHALRSDAKVFLEKIHALVSSKTRDTAEWQKKYAKYKTYNAVPTAWRSKKNYMDPYVFIDMLSDELTGSDTMVVDGGGTALYMPFQAFKFKKGQRMVVSGGISAMGTGLPESIGACFANRKRRTICFIGDGSMQFNIHELQTIVHHNLPIKIIIFNNQGYLAMRHTQDGFLKSRYVGSDPKGGLSLPDYQKIAAAFGIKAVRIKNYKEAVKKIKTVIAGKGPMICEIMTPADQKLIPGVGFKKNPDGTATGLPLEDMAPHLKRKEFLENMIVEPLKESLELVD